MSLVLGFGLEHSCPWPREGLSSKRLSLALASDFFVSLALASSLMSSTPPLIFAAAVSQYQSWSRGHKARGQGQGHKKIRGQGQGQPIRGPTFSRPRTGMLEAKTEDQGHSRKCFRKKRGLQKSFSSNLQLFGVARIFDWGAQTTNHMQ